MTGQDPIFIHSLFRAGSTYLFNCFRRSPAGYWCYQEPLNEYLLKASLSPELLLEVHDTNARHLRHPKLNLPYFYEFYELAPLVSRLFVPSFSYEEYFTDQSPEADRLCEYLTMLAAGARGRPVFQECRSSGRVAGIRKCLGGTHIYLWRNPWDQWWSYKVDSHFEICNLSILASSRLPPVFEALKALVHFSPKNNSVESLVAQRLDAPRSYMLFFAIWCHGMLEALPRCDLAINIDKLSWNLAYRRDVRDALEARGIGGLEFSDSAVPLGGYGEEDRSFFQDLEETVLALFARHGYAADAIASLNEKRQPALPLSARGSKYSEAAVAELWRLRLLSLRLESELSGAQREIGKVTASLEAGLHESAQNGKPWEAAAAELASVKEQVATQEARVLELEAALAAKEGERRKVEEALWANESIREKTELALWKVEAARQELERRYWDMEAEREAAASALSVSEQSCNELKLTLAADKAEHARLESLLMAENERAKQLAATLHSQVEETKRLEGALAAATSQLAVVKTSLSWRLGQAVHGLVRHLIGTIKPDKGTGA